MPFVPPKSDDSVLNSVSTSSVVYNQNRECPACLQSVSDSNDKFCRNCGLRILMNCAKCHHPVRPSDKFCGSCGAKRYKFYEFWRYGQLHRSPAFVLGATAAVTLAYIGLLVYFRKRGVKY